MGRAAISQLYPTGWLKQLQGLLTAHPGESGIVYCPSKRKTEERADWLNDQGFRALAYHAGPEAGTRAARQQRF